MQLQNSTVSWPEVIFAAVAADDPFEDIQIITARTQLVNLAYAAAADYLHGLNIALTEASVTAFAISLIAQQKLYVQESVEVGESGIVVCVNTQNVDSDDTTFRALDLVQRALDQLDDAMGIVHFGEHLQFSISELVFS